MLKSMLIVGAGSFVGGALRYWLSALVAQAAGVVFPWGTLCVNLLGGLLIGFLYGLFSRCGMVGSAWCLLLATGFCGGFTTFSAFSRETFLLLQGGHGVAFAVYVLLSLVGALVLVAAGDAVARWL